MGLDMYLESIERKHNGLSFENVMRLEKELCNGEIEKGSEKWALIEPYIDKSEPSYPTIKRNEVAYWRKANAIHRFFTKNEENDYYRIRVGKLDIQELKDICKDLISIVYPEINNRSDELQEDSLDYWLDYFKNQIEQNPKLKSEFEKQAKEKLPTQAGFFFGSTEYDEWYFNSLVFTYNKMLEILETFDFENYWLSYFGWYWGVRYV